jgi:hypothetical protein
MDLMLCKKKINKLPHDMNNSYTFPDQIHLGRNTAPTLIFGEIKLSGYMLYKYYFYKIEL